MEGIIKSVSIDPIVYNAQEIGGQPKSLIKVYFDANALVDFYKNAGLMPEEAMVYYIKYTNGNIGRESISLLEAAASGHEVSNYVEVKIQAPIG